MLSLRPSNARRVSSSVYPFQPSGLGVEPRNGDPFTTAWSYVAAYRASSTALELVLLTAPPLKLDLSKLDAARRSRLVGLAVMNRVPEVK